MSAGTSRPNSKGSLRRNRVDSDRTPLLPKDAQVQNSKAARVYVFGDADVMEDELADDHEMSEIRPRGRARTQRRHMEALEAAEPQYLERAIADGDTLQGVALKFGVQVRYLRLSRLNMYCNRRHVYLTILPLYYIHHDHCNQLLAVEQIAEQYVIFLLQVAELKRINNLIKDQDFFALRVIKVPMKRYSLLTDLVNEENKEAANSAKLTLNANGFESSHSQEANETDSSSENELFVRTLSIRDSLLSDQGKQAASFLQRMDKDLKSIVNSTKSQKDSLEDVVQTMTCKRIYPLQQQSSWLNGYDCGMRWWSVLLAFIVFGFVAPLLYFIYLEIHKKWGS